MKNHHLIIYDFEILFNILDEIKEHLNFKIINIPKEKYKDLLANYSNSIIISKTEIKKINSTIILKKFPFKLKELNVIINTKFLKRQFNIQSNQSIGLYNLDFNAKKIFKGNVFLDLTEKEIKLIEFLKFSKYPVSIIQLQDRVWGYVSSLETHTVETHVYRLRKKISKTFGDEEFIISDKAGYSIK